MSGPIETAYVRIRADLHGLREEATAGVRSALRGVQQEVTAASRSTVTSTQREIQANVTLTNSYREVGAAAARTSEEQVAGAEAAGTATLAAERKMTAGAVEAGAAATALKEKFLSFGKVLGIAIGADVFVHLVKDVTEGAAAVQKSGEVIRDTFGPDASKVVVGFGESFASSLNITAEQADATAAKLGIVFQNLHVGRPLAAEMTVNLEKLAGSLSKIRGVDPGPVLDTLNRAMLGNVRSLKQLGVSVDPAQEKIVALRLGLIQQGEALTPAARAIAIYALATANLGKYLDEAKRHSKDYADEQRHLSVEIHNTKEAIGTALLPVFNRYTTRLADYLEKANKSGEIQKELNGFLEAGGSAFNTVKGAIDGVVAVAKPLVGELGGVKNATKDLLVLWASIKLAGLIGQFARFAAEAKLLRLQLLGLQTLGPIIITVEVIGLEKVAKKIKDLQEKVIADQSHVAAKGSSERRTLIPAIAKEIVDFKAQGVSTGDILTRLRSQLGGGSAGDAIIAAAFDYSVPKATAYKQKLVDEINQTTKAATDATTKAVTAAVNDTSTSAASQAAIEAAGKKAADAVIASAQAGITETKQKLADLQTKLHDQIAQNARDLTDAINQAKSNLISIGSTLASTLGAAIDAPFNVAARKIQDAQDKLAVFFDRKNAKLAAEQAKLSAAQAKLGLAGDQRSLERLRESVILPGGGALAADPTKALAQLQELAKKSPTNAFAIQDFITQYQQAVLQVKGDKLGIRQQALAAAQAAKETPLTIQSDVLRVGQDAADRRKTAITQRIADLTAGLASHKISIKQFNQQIAELLGADKASYEKAGKILGSAFESGFQSQVKGLIKQAKAIAAGPQRPGTGQEPTVVNPLLVLQKGQRELHSITRQIGNTQIQLQRRIAVATEKAAKASAAAQKKAQKTAATAAASRAVVLGPTSNDLNPGRQSHRSKTLTGTTN